MDYKVAFRCKNCGRLHEAEHAGDNEYPHSCTVCGAGVKHAPGMEEIGNELCDPNCTLERRKELGLMIKEIAIKGTGAKTIHNDNWEILADLSDEHLNKYGLKKEHVCKHKPKKNDGIVPVDAGGSTQILHRHTVDGVGTVEKV